ncbi:response regulator [Modestobacter sp. URMC 112]
MLTALVVAADGTTRAQLAGLLELAGWHVDEATSAAQALALDASVTPDLVVTDAVLPDAGAPRLLSRLRRAGSTAHLLVVAAGPTDQLRARCTAAGALACLTAPVDAGLLLDLLERRTALRPDGPVPPADGDHLDADLGAHPHDEDLGGDLGGDLDDDLDGELLDRLQELYADALPGRLSAITGSARRGDPRAVAAAAQTLAGTSGQLGHPEVAGICRAIAADARRGVLAHHLVADLATLALAGASPSAPLPAGAHPSGLRLVLPADH